MEKKSSGVLQGQINTIVSKAPILSPIFSNEEVGVSLREIYRKYNGLSEKHTKIFINGTEVSDWGYNPKSGDTVSICQVPQGVVEAVIITAIVTAVVGLVVGFVLYSMIDQPTSPGQGEKLQRVTGAKNAAKPYEPIPAILGTRRVVPTYAAQPYTYWVGDKQWLKMLLCVGYGPLRIDDIKIGDAPISNFRDVNYRVLDWYFRRDTNNIREIWNTDIQQDQVNQELGRNDYISRAAPAGTNKIRLDMIYPQGLWRTSDGDVGSSVGAMQFRYKANGNWYSVARVHNIGSSWVAARSVVKDTVENRYYIAYRGGGGVAWINPDASNGAVRPLFSNLFEITDRVVLEKDGYAYIKDVGGSFRYVNTQNYYHSTRDQLVKSFSFRPIDPLTGDLVTSEVPIEMKRMYWDYDPDGASFSTTLQLNSITYEINNNIPDSYFGIDPANNQYPVLIALDVRATEQLSGVIDNLSCQATSVLPSSSVFSDWRNKSVFDFGWAPTNNPARLYKWALQGYFSRGLVANDKIDSLSLLNWETTCSIEGWETNEIVNYKITVKDLLSNIAFTGRAFFSMTDGQYSIIENTPKSSPVQVFTQKNSSGLSSRREFPLATDGIEYTFANGDFQDQEDEGFYGDPTKFVNGDVDRPRAGSNFTGRFDELELWGTTNPVLARRHARFAYNEKKLRREVYQLETDIESLVARRGDKVAIAHDMIEVGLGQGFIKAIGTGTFKVDETINLVAGTEYTLTVRSIDNGVVVNTLTATYDGNGQWTGTLPAAAANGDLVAYGEGGTEVLECLVTEIAYSDNFAATLTLKNYAPQLYDLERTPIPKYQTGLTPERRRDVRPQPPSISANAGEFSYESNSITIDVARAQGDPAQVSYFTLEYRYKEQNPPVEDGEVQDLDDTTDELWTDGGVSPASNGRFTIPISNLQGNIILVRSQAVNEAGVYSDPTDETEVVLDDNPAPDVEDFTLTELVNTPKTPDGTTSTLVIEITPPASLRNYAYSIAEYRQPGQEDYQEIGVVGWKDGNQITTEVTSDGRQYEVRLRSVSVYGVTNGVGLTKIITTTNVQDPEYTEDNPYEALPVPNVTGLELFEQGNDTEFGGKDAKFTWRKNSIGDWVELGYEGLRGAGAGRLDQYFRDYQVEIRANNNLVRTEFVVDALYTYTYEKNAEDYEREEGAVGAYRDFQVRVYERGRNNQISETPAVIDVSNTPPKPLVGLSIVEGFNVIEIAYKKPVDLDFAGVDIWVEGASGFDPDVEDPLITTSDNNVVVSGLAQGSTYYVRVRPFDDFGKTGTNTSSEFEITTKTGLDVTGLSGWAYQIDPADRQFIVDNLEDAAVPSTKIENLTAAKITAGTINATGGITTETIFRAVDDINTPTVQVGMGPATFGGATTYLLWAYNGTDFTFGVDELGNAYFSGELEASSFTNNNLTIDASGNLDSTGTFRFGGETTDYIDFDGTNLLIETDNFSVDAAGNATFSGELNAASGTLGDDTTDQYVRYTGSILEIGPGVTIGSNEDRTVTVGTGGDFATINEALEELSRVVPAYKSGGFNAIITLLTGFVIAEQIYVNGVDLSWITINSESGEVHQIDETAMTENVALVGTARPAFTCVGGGRSPRIDFRMGYPTGVSEEGAIYCRGEGSIITANQIYVENARFPSIYVSQGGSIFCDGDVENYGSNFAEGIIVETNASLEVTGSVTSNGNSEAGLLISSNARVSVTEDINCNNNVGEGIRMQAMASLLCGVEITCTGNGLRALFMTGNSTIRASSLITTNNGSGPFMNDSSEVYTSFQWDASNTGGVYMQRSCTARVGSNLNCGPDDLTMIDGCFVSRSSGSTGGVINVTPNTIGGDGILLEFNPGAPG